MLGADHSETLAGGKLLLFTRNGIFQARVYRGERQYLFRSLKTTDLKQARNLALRFLHETEFKQTAGMPLQQLQPELGRQQQWLAIDWPWGSGPALRRRLHPLPSGGAQG